VDGASIDRIENKIVISGFDAWEYIVFSIQTGSNG
jgi:hypothetical protein